MDHIWYYIVLSGTYQGWYWTYRIISDLATIVSGLSFSHTSFMLVTHQKEALYWVWEFIRDRIAPQGLIGHTSHTSFLYLIVNLTEGLYRSVWSRLLTDTLGWACYIIGLGL